MVLFPKKSIYCQHIKQNWCCIQTGKFVTCTVIKKWVSICTVQDNQEAISLYKRPIKDADLLILDIIYGEINIVYYHTVDKVADVIKPTIKAMLEKLQEFMLTM